MDLLSLVMKIKKWLSVDSNIIQLKKLLNKIAFFLVVGAHFLTGGFSEALFWSGILIAIFGTYLNWKW